MDKIRVVFLGSKPIGFQCLKYLIEQSDALHISVIGLMTRSRTEFGTGFDLTTLATQNEIPIIPHLDDLPECDVIYSVQYHEILKPAHIAKANLVAVNLHMAPLPEYRGSNQFTFAILDGKKEFGTTIHKIEAGIDNGDILFQKRFPIPEGCWVNELYDRTYEESLSLFRYTLGHIVTGNFQPVPQANLVARYGSSFHSRKEMESAKVIDIGWGQERIERTLRATYMPGFEPPYCLVDGGKVFFSRKA